MHLSIPIFVVGLAVAGGVQAQPLDVTFRYIPAPGETVVSAFVRADFNGWVANAGNAMTFVDSLQQWVFTERLPVGGTQEYKIYVDGVWLTDPLNPVSNPADNNNSVLTVADPMVFQLGREENAGGMIDAVSAGVFSTDAITEIRFEVNGVEQDGLPFYDPASGLFRHELDEPVARGSQFKITAATATETASAQVGVLAPEVEDAARPAGIVDGITYFDNPTTATLSLFAPGKRFVYVIGDFNNWQIDDAYLMRRDAASDDSVLWWLELDGLNPAQEYAYQYLVDGELRIADPYAEKMLVPGSDADIVDQGVYPDLKTYPEGQSGVVSILQTAQEPFSFSDFERPLQQDLVIYELLIRDFIARHDYATLVDTLDYLDRLGVSAIELMPVAEFDGNESWGYNPAFYFAPDKYYGPADDLKRFIDECHQRGIAVILDVVYNHATGQSPFVRLYNTGGFGPPTADNPWFNEVAPPGSFSFFYDVDHETAATQHWLDRVNRHWLEQYNIDGFRFDFTKGFTNTPGDGAAYDPARVAILKRMANQIWAVDSTAYIILEHFGSDQEERELAEYRTGEGFPGMLFWNNVNHAYNEATMGYHSGSTSDFSRVYYETRGFSRPSLVSYMESHDEQWLMFKNRKFGACANSPFGGNRCDPNLDANFGTYNVRHLPTALDRMKMAGAFFFLIPGPKMMWQFGELGYGFGDAGEQCLRSGGNDDCDPPGIAPGRVDNKPIRWDYRADPLREKLYKAWAALINLRNDHEVFRSTETTVTLDLRGAVKRIHLSHPEMDVAIVGNFDVGTWLDVQPGFQETGRWYDFFTGDSLLVQDLNYATGLEPGEFHVYTSQRIMPPEAGLITVDVEDEADVPAAFRLDQNYPNPFNPATTIRYALAQAGPVRLDVFDVLGRRVATLADGFQTPGTYVVDFDAGHLPSGPYFYRLQTAGGIETRRMMLIK